MYRVLVKFRDLQDEHVYKVGDKFPHDNRRISKKRIEELSSESNRRGVVLIKKIED